MIVSAGFRPSHIRCHRHKFGLNTFARCRAAGPLEEDRHRRQAPRKDLIVGGTDFIGRHFVDRLLAHIGAVTPAGYARSATRGP
jgi:hypothetical protein